MAQEVTYVLRCPTCGKPGDVVQSSPHEVRQCAKGHRWPSGRVPQVSGYVPLSIRLEDAQGAIQEVLEALVECDSALRDCSSYLTPAQWAQVGGGRCLYLISEMRARYGRKG